ncbi:hypothetical protein XA68_15634 [Ophiocordyceps unilateralis]|uniref:DUF7029 domain-containing protein n=1 Tax=Ophiocordyceps unilateralis TaxID=268505 RepID=A0A2A9PM59_OPHUN|nr:hypothetical protein XA68_15634 [Ophiocordyceps unilateralis]
MLSRISVAIVAAAGAVQALPAPEHTVQNSTAAAGNGSYAVPTRTHTIRETHIHTFKPESAKFTNFNDDDGGACDDAFLLDQDVLQSPVTSPFSSPSAGYGYNRFGFQYEQTATFAVNGPIATLAPNVHWDFDTKPAANVRPIMPGTGSELYYGHGDPEKSGRFAFLTYYFTSPSVNLDHSDHVKVVSYEAHTSASATMIVRFTSQEAFGHAERTWSVKNGLILISYVRGCGDYDKGDRCYFKATSLEKHTVDGRLEMTVKGEIKLPETIITGGETEWGVWIPRKNDRNRGNPSPSASDAASFSWAPTTSSSARPSYTPFPTFTTAVSPSPTAPTNRTQSLGRDQDANSCHPPVDTKYGLPTACLGDYFDQDLDNLMGYEGINAADEQFLRQLYPVFDQEADPTTPGFDFRPHDPVWKKHRRSVRLEKRLWPFSQIWKAIKRLIQLSASINKEFSWQLPSPEQVDKIQDEHAKQVESPWGDAILLKSYSSGESEEEREAKYLHVYCVGCGVKGQARINGRASWGIGDGITEAKVDFHTDMEFVLKLGIDARISYAKEFETELLEVGLPGLQYGPVTFGPWISLGAKVKLEAAAKGRLLAGAEMGLHDAHIVIDYKATEPVQSGWEPYFKPVLEANGALMISAELGLPMALKAGLKIASFERAAKLVDEPSVKAVAQVAASVALNHTAPFSAGFDETDGCGGILTRIAWRNKLWADAFGLKTYNLFDTDDRTLAPVCIPLPPRVQQKVPLLMAEPTFQNSSGRLDAQNLARHSGPIRDQTRPLLQSLPGGFSDELSYSVTGVQDMSYNNTHGVEYGRLVDHDETTMVASCSNGNMYAVVAERTENNTACSALWAATADNTMLMDGASRIMHYGTESMAKAGVSRIRLGPADELHRSSRLVVWTVEYNPDAPEGMRRYYLVRNADGDVFYPLVCEYSNGEGAKVFLAKDPDEGVKTLESDDVAYSITGGYVSSCHGLLLLQEEHDHDKDPVFYSISGGEDEFSEYTRIV